MNLKVLLAKLAERYGRKTAIVFHDRRVSFLELEQTSNRVAHALIKLGVRKGDRVAMLLSNSPEFAAVYFGIVKTGGLAVLLDPKFKFMELASLLDDCQPKLLVTESPYLEPLAPFLSRLKSVKRVITLNSGGGADFLSYSDMIADSPDGPVAGVEIGPDDLAHIAYSSAPAYRPRGAMLVHQDIITSAELSAEAVQQTEKDVEMLFALPLHHAFGLIIVFLGALARGSTVVMLPGVSIDELTQVIEREKVTIFMGVPFVFELMLRVVEQEELKSDLSSLRLCLSAGSTLNTGTMERFQRVFGLGLAQFYGLTEGVSAVTYQSRGGADDKLTSVGKPLPGYVIKVVDDSGKELAVNQVGEVIVRGPIMKGYYRNPNATAEVIKNGWLYTGDLGRIDKDGSLFLVGLKREMIITKGQNIFPTDIEKVLRSHPQVAEAAVVGVPDELRGEVVRAVISLKHGVSLTDADIIRFCREYLADYKLPRQVIFVKSLPKTAAGKISKEALRALLFHPNPVQSH
ncbi:MAG: AMP-binding protein [Chloroflexota bacterium]|nr:AMP-binding protein [Chloroflexota bacterium]